MPERRTYAMLLRYDGGPYKGWQPQPGLPTVGEVVAEALHRAGVGATPFGASRTDAGVHARAQVATFSSRADLDPRRVARLMNEELPTTVRVLALRPVDKSFHAHWSSIGKTYRYRISFRGEAAAWRLPCPRLPTARLDLAALEKALAAITRAADVSALCDGEERRPRQVARAQVLQGDAGGAVLEFGAAGFGKHQVRRLVFGATQVAAGLLGVEAFERVLAGDGERPRRADAEGLSLYRVHYPAALDPFPDVDSLTSLER